MFLHPLSGEQRNKHPLYAGVRTWYTDAMSEQYKAFISYRHMPADIAAAKEVQKRLEHFHIPSSIRKKYGIKEIGRLFRDQDELPITSDISDNITDALKNSEWLIVICSTETASSRWVAREIDEFLKTHPLRNVLTILVNGEPGEVIPDVLLSEPVKRILEDGTERIEMVPREPLSCDMRKGLKEARNAEIPRLAAALIGCAYDELVQRQKQYKTKRLTALLSSFSMLTTGAAGYMTWSRGQIQNNLRQAQTRESQYLVSEAREFLNDHDNLTAAQIAIEALPTPEKPRPLVPEALNVLSSAVNAYRAPSTDYTNNGKYTMQAPIYSYSVNETGELLALTDETMTFALYDLKTNKEIPFTCMYTANTAVFVKEDHLLISDGNTIQMYDVSDSKVTWEYNDPMKYHFSPYVCGDAEKTVMLEMHSILVFDSSTGELLLHKDYGDETIYTVASYTDPILSQDDRYIYSFSLNYMENDNRILQVDLETGNFTQINTVCEDLVVMCALENGFAAAGTLSANEHNLPDTLRVEIYDTAMNLTGSYEEEIGLNRSIKGIQEIVYTEDGIEQKGLAVIYDNREILLDPVSGTLRRQILFPETIAVPFLNVTSASQLHLNTHGQQSGYVYEDKWFLFGEQEFPENMKSAKTAVAKDGARSIFVLEQGGRSLQRYTQGVFDADMEDLGTPDNVRITYIAGAEKMEDSLLYVSLTDDKLYVGRITDETHTAASIPESVGYVQKIGVMKDRILYQAGYTGTGEPVLLTVKADGTASLIPVPDAQFPVIASDTLYNITSDGIYTVDPDTWKKEKIMDGYFGFYVKDPGSDRILEHGLSGYRIIDLKKGTIEELPGKSENMLIGFSEDGKTVYAVQDGVFEDLQSGETMTLPVKNAHAAYLSGDTLYLLSNDGILTITDRKDGHTVKQIRLSGNAAGKTEWVRTLDTLYVYTAGTLYLLDPASYTEYAAVKNCIAFDPETGEFYVQYMDMTTAESRTRIGRFHKYNAAELLAKGLLYTGGAQLEESLRLRYGLHE